MWTNGATTHKNEEPPYKESPKLKFLSALRVTHILVDELTLALYMREMEEVKQFLFSKSPPPHTIVKDKVSYIFLRVNQIVALMPMVFDKFSIEPIELRAVQDFT